MALVGPNPFENTVTNTMVELTNARTPPCNMNTNSFSHSEPFNNNNVRSNLHSSVNASFGSSSFKKKRGRPRKYFPDGNITLGSSSVPTQNAAIISPSSLGSCSIKKKRGRPRKYFLNGNITLGSSSVPTQNAAIISPSSTMKKNQQVEVLGDNGTDFSAHLITVNHGENIVAKLASCCQGGPNTEICILSAQGLVGIASFQQSGVIVTYEVVHFPSFY
ncbi:AT-hook motif nuclear-localized protein 1 [Medicago truncatula]|uniref:AT-hook motif nuclear-localized protein 1 n=1 Tax=Medicago truncatula TaxID=3880 RepID=UPI00196803B9|nr:AT-hook motif nuclear-localized protein 1 [Medicago truncatula]